MANPDQLEVYRQRYETFRHLDRVRWQMLQIAVAVGALVVTFGGSGTDGPEWWVLAVAGWLLTTLGLVMLRVNHGIKKNQEALIGAATSVGDPNIPPPGVGLKSRSNLAAASVLIFGVICIGLAIAVGLSGSGESTCTRSSSATIMVQTRSTKTN